VNWTGRRFGLARVALRLAQAALRLAVIIKLTQKLLRNLHLRKQLEQQNATDTTNTTDMDMDAAMEMVQDQPMIGVGVAIAVLLVTVVLGKICMKKKPAPAPEPEPEPEAAPTPAKRPAKSPPRSTGKKTLYITIDGNKYDRSLVEEADTLLSSRSNSKLGASEARKLWKLAKDGPGVTDIERATLAYIAEEYTMTPEGAEFLKAQIEETASGSGYYAEIEPKLRSGEKVKVDRKMWAEISLMAKDGKIDKTDVVKIFEGALDGPGVTKTEKATMEKALAEFDFTAGAKKYLTAQLATV
tara:strand:+ start:323 stop:1219 length:897 start_codon:yes stop_codon:yes gene_type:complete